MNLKNILGNLSAHISMGESMQYIATATVTPYHYSINH